MLPRFWLLTILASLALAVPVPRESVTPSVTFGDSTSDNGLLAGPTKMGLNSANKPSNQLKDNKNKGGSKTTQNNQGSPTLGGYSAHGTGVSFRTSGQGSGISPPSSLSTATSGGISGGTSKELKEGGLHGGHGEHSGGMRGGKMHKKVKPDGSGSTTGSTGSAASDGTTTDSDSISTGTTTGSESTTSGTTTDSEGITGSDEVTISTSKHK